VKINISVHENNLKMRVLCPSIRADLEA